jgi:hypothetical protein
MLDPVQRLVRLAAQRGRRQVHPGGKLDVQIGRGIDPHSGSAGPALEDMPAARAVR